MALTPEIPDALSLNLEESSQTEPIASINASDEALVSVIESSAQTLSLTRVNISKFKVLKRLGGKGVYGNAFENGHLGVGRKRPLRKRNDPELGNSKFTFLR
jgi:hypothetical protein